MLSILHTAEQLEAARMHDSKTDAVRIIRRHLLAKKLSPTLGACARLMNTYWENPGSGIALIDIWNPNKPAN